MTHPLGTTNKFMQPLGPKKIHATFQDKKITHLIGIKNKNYATSLDKNQTTSWDKKITSPPGGKNQATSWDNFFLLPLRTKKNHANGNKLLQMIPNDCGYSNGPTLSQTVPNGPKQSQTVPNGPKWSNDLGLRTKD